MGNKMQVLVSPHIEALVAAIRRGYKHTYILYNIGANRTFKLPRSSYKLQESPEFATYDRVLSLASHAHSARMTSSRFVAASGAAATGGRH